MIANLRHVAWNVADIEKSKIFFIKMGASLESEDLEVGRFIDNLLGLENSAVKTCKLRFLDGSRVELMQFMSPPPVGVENGTVGPLAQLELGLHHIALTVIDIKRAIALVIESGGSLIGGPVETTTEHSKHAVPALHAYCLDPMGSLLHLAEDRRPEDSEKSNRK